MVDCCATGVGFNAVKDTISLLPVALSPIIGFVLVQE